MENKIFIITGPSGAGEDSVIAGLKEKFEIEKVITTTTRKMRPGEKNGREYYFVTKEDFERGLAENLFFEWVEEDNGNLYGGTFAEIERVKNSKKVGIWKIDYQGALAAKTLIPEAISIFIYIPMALIKKRLQARGSHSEKFIKDRLEYAKGWFDNRKNFDYEVMNEEGKLDRTVEKVAKIIQKELF